jgi:hypothetical protein
MLMKVLDVKSTSGTRQGTMFLIESVTSDVISIRQLVSISFEDTEYYFEVVEISTAASLDLLNFKAQEVGYYNLFTRKSNFDIRQLLGKTINVIEDEEVY